MPPAISRNPYMRATFFLAVLTVMVVAAWLVWRPGRALQFTGFLPLHTFFETCSIVVYVLVFAISHMMPGDQRNRNMALLGAAFLGVALLDFLHTMSYSGMPAFVTPSSVDKAINFWLAARFLAAGALLAAAIASWRPTITSSRGHRWTVGVLAAVAVVAWVNLYRPHWPPETFSPERGPTLVKISVELVIIAMSLIAASRFYRQAILPREVGGAGTTYDPVALAAATLVTAMAEVFFVIDTDANGLLNVFGHIYQVIGAWLICRGLVAANLYEMQTRNSLALEAAQLGVWTWYVRTDAIEWDVNAARIWGKSAKVQPTMSALDALVHPDDLKEMRKALRKALEPGGDATYRAECRIVDADGAGERRVASLGKTEFRDGKPVRIIAIVRDVTDRRRAEDAIMQSEARISGILSIAADAIISIDDRQHIVMFNHGAERIFGYASSDVVGKPLDMLLPQRFRGDHGGHIRRFAASGIAARHMGERREIFGLRKDGAEFPAEASISKLEQGGARTFTVVLRDVSERKHAEQALALSRQELEARVAERTSELRAETERRLEAQAALSRAQRMEAFGQLAGGIAHDFNNLLTVITGNQELLEMQLQDPKQLALLKRSQEAAEMGARLTGRLLTFARRRQLEPALLDLNEQIIGMVELLRRSIGEDVTLTTNLAPRLWLVKTDASEVENAVLNLAINARDAMPNGGTLVIETADCTIDEGEIGGESKLAPGDYVRISVSDSGTGMSPDVLARAFEPFFTTKPPGKGTGLGLSTIYGFVQQSGGTVTVHSRTAIGTTVNIYLPRATDAGSRPGAARPGLDIPPAMGETVLIVEDNADVREVATKRLQGLGYTILEAENGPAAVAMIQASGRRADIVFSDVVMPGGMSGFDLARWINANAPSLKVLLTSGYPDDVAGARAAQPPGIRILRKPYNRGELARALRDVIDGQP